METTTPLALLEKKCRSPQRAAKAMEALSTELGIRSPIPTNPLAVLALIRLGQDGEKVSSLLKWNEFEDLCAKLLLSAGFDVQRNIVLTKPRKQIDLIATSSLICLCVDCKHYLKSINPSLMAKFAADQLGRTKLYKEKKNHRGPVLPVVLTLLEGDTLVVDGVPVVPLLKLRSFLQSVTPYDGFAVV